MKPNAFQAKSPFKFSGFHSPNYTIVPDELFDQLLVELSGAELKVLLYIIRRTFGFKRDKDSISLSQMLRGIVTREGNVLDRGVGLSKPTLLQTLRGLVGKGIIASQRCRSVARGDEPTVYQLCFAEGHKEQAAAPVVKKVYQGVVNKLDLPVVKKSAPQETVLQETEKQQQVVAERLLEWKIGSEKVQSLSSRYSPDHIQEKVELLLWKLKGATRTKTIEDPAAWLIQAIEGDYKPPPAFYTAQVRREKNREKVVAFEELEKHHERNKAEAEARKRQLYDEAFKRLQKGYGTTAAEQTLWAKVLKRIRQKTDQATYQFWFPETQLLSIAGHVAVVGVPHQVARRKLETELAPLIIETLTGLLPTTGPDKVKAIVPTLVT